MKIICMWTENICEDRFHTDIFSLLVNVLFCVILKLNHENGMKLITSSKFILLRGFINFVEAKPMKK